MPIRAKREVHRLSGYLIEGAVWGPTSTQNLFLFLFHLPASPLSASTLNRQLPEYRSLTVAANSNNFQTHPICNLLSTKEITYLLTYWIERTRTSLTSLRHPTRLSLVAASWSFSRPMSSASWSMYV